MAIAKQASKAVLRKAIVSARKIDTLRYLLDEASLQNPRPNTYAERTWLELDRIYTICRRQLQSQPAWRYGPARVHEVAQEGFQAISEYTTLQGKMYCDLGCGKFHPYGISTVMFLNGAASTIATDLVDSDKQRAAEALADLLCNCISSPNKWNWSGKSTNDFLSRAGQFNLDALQAGQLSEGLQDVPLEYIVTDIHNPAIKENSIDVMTSRAVLEYFLDFGVAVDRLFALMRSGGIAFHHIDITDPRSHNNPHFHSWSFLAENEDWADGFANPVNRLRSSEIRTQLEKAGFKILRYENRVGQIPKGFKDRVVSPFREMPNDELNATGVFCVLKKP